MKVPSTKTELCMDWFDSFSFGNSGHLFNLADSDVPFLIDVALIKTFKNLSLFSCAEHFLNA